jgi:hypothetical protein
VGVRHDVPVAVDDEARADPLARAVVQLVEQVVELAVPSLGGRSGGGDDAHHGGEGGLGEV